MRTTTTTATTTTTTKPYLHNFLPKIGFRNKRFAALMDMVLGVALLLTLSAPKPSNMAHFFYFAGLSKSPSHPTINLDYT